MILKMFIRRIQRNKRKFIFTLIALMLISIVANYITIRLSTDMNAVKAYISSKANIEVLFDADNINVSDISKLCHIIAYIRYNNGIVLHNNQKYFAMIGNGWINILNTNISAPSDDSVVVLGLPNIKSGDYLYLYNKRVRVVKSYFFPSEKPIVLYHNANGTKIFLLAKAKDAKKLINFLNSRTRIYLVLTYKKNWQPYSDRMKGLETFIDTILFLTLSGILVLIIANSIASIRSMHRELFVLKYIGLPNSALAILSFGEYILSSVTGYLIGIPIGCYLAYMKITESAIPASVIDYTTVGKMNILFLIVIILSTLLSVAYVSRLKPVSSKTRESIRRRKTTLAIICITVGLLIGLPISSMLLSYTPITLIDGLPCKYIIYGPVDRLNIPGDYGAYMGGQLASNGEINVTVGLYMFPVNSKIVPSVVSDGRWVHNRHEAVISRGLALKLGLKIGDYVYVYESGSWTRYRIVGISDLLLNNGLYIITTTKPGYVHRVLFTSEDLSDKTIISLLENGYLVYSSKNFREIIQNNIMIFTIGAFMFVVMMTIACIAALSSIANSEILANIKTIASLKAIGIPDRYCVLSMGKNILGMFLVGFFASIPISTYIAQQLLLLVVPLPITFQAVLKSLHYMISILLIVIVSLLAILYKIIKGINIILELR